LPGLILDARPGWPANKKTLKPGSDHTQKVFGFVFDWRPKPWPMYFPRLISIIGRRKLDQANAA
jgi:hypothetical protein